MIVDLYQVNCGEIKVIQRPQSEMIRLLKKYLHHRQNMHDVFCHFWIALMKYQSGVWGSILFYTKAKLYGVLCNGKVVCYGKVDLIRGPFSEIVFGNNVVLISSSYRATSTSIFAPVKIQTFSRTAYIRIENDVSLNGTSIVARTKKVIIGAGTIVAPNVSIMDSDFHALWPPENRPMNPAFENDMDVIIGENVWIGTRSVILKGTIIGDNSIIGAGSVVTGSIPKNVVAAGNPAKVIKELV